MKTIHTSYFLLVMLMTFLSITSCRQDTPIDNFDSVLDIPDTDGLGEYGFPTGIDINDNGMVIGWPSESNGPREIGIENPSSGFAIHISGSRYVNLSPSDAFCSWPYDINESDMVVGGYLPTKYTENAEYEILPTYAFVIKADGTGYENLHDSSYRSTFASHINDEGDIFGWFEQDESLYACRFYQDGTPATELRFHGYSEISIMAVNNTTAVLEAKKLTDLSRVILTYTIADESISELPFDVIQASSARIHAIDNEGRMVGSMGKNNDHRSYGMVYKIGDDAPRLFGSDIKEGPWYYQTFEFTDIGKDGRLVGMVGRDQEQWGGTNYRAFTVNLDFTGFEDITPNNTSESGHAEARAINNMGLIIGNGELRRRGPNGTFRHVFVVQK